MAECGGFGAAEGKTPVISVDEGHGLALVSGGVDALQGHIFRDFYQPNIPMVAGTYPATGFSPNTRANDIALSPDGNYTAIRSNDTVKVFLNKDLSTWDSFTVGIETSMSAVSRIMFSPDSRFLACADSAATVTHTTVRNVASKTSTDLTSAANDSALAIGWSHGSERLFVSSGGGAAGDSKFYVYESNTWTKITEVAHATSGFCYQLAVSPDDRFVAFMQPIATTSRLLVYGARTFRLISSAITIPGVNVNAGSGLTWSPNAAYLAVAHGTTPFAKLYGTYSGDPANWTDTALPATTLDDDGLAVDFSSNSRILALVGKRTPATENAAIVLYDITTTPKTVMTSIDLAFPENDQIIRAAFSPGWR